MLLYHSLPLLRNNFNKLARPSVFLKILPSIFNASLKKITTEKAVAINRKYLLEN